MEKIIQFFNFALPCPEEIPGCQALREEYTREINEAKRRGGCGGCIERNFRNQYTLRLQSLLVEKK